MRNVWIGLGALAAVIALTAGTVLVMASMEPDDIHVERELIVPGTPADAYVHARDLRAVNGWSPWVERDPTLTATYSDPSAGVGAWYEWDGNDEVGRGRMTVIEDVPNEKVVHELSFLEPFESKASASILIEPKGDEVRVVWTFDQPQDLGSKVFTMFFDMEGLLGPDYERGLQKLEPLIAQTVAARQALEEAEAIEAAGDEAPPADAVPADEAAGGAG